MGVFNQRGRCCDCGAEFLLHVSVKRFAGESLPDGEVDIDICPECGSYSVEDALMILGREDNYDDTCTVVFRVSKELMDSRDFLYALACRTDGWKGVEIVHVQLPERCSELPAIEGHNHE
ncbi:hypothetical protein HXW90_21970 [Pseudomonas sp. Y39-6]|uniref:hypothetical protein n=1 Tax=Pseudomonas sp. Y39-6 TaxID=2749807 RepID=UPI0019101244|nr:hypothetical protein [Pseudomonas sp. Y39-6]QPO22018.1 hypothetical protein HXW90_21970 [Pseudomonas sp. Y39-6]URS59339.1 hypothetical protein JN756_22485 [Pseudomonas sp. Y39-6]